ncbi:acetyl-CoA carboxylase biotin carboxyl carrier protein [Evansella vedderi]|uniref:Biotin carboxyl carrier protein of acetyl-CoA carboxylase n=1 Tax=Evansella vedderi TaxID=38282 RepID=A0ABT9ZZH7_9BACI|nr:acetyl-CoA carboxylase biotin carboxyl carrier protein [Evansella vedderi]MDQ0256254.1 acetyl-CoA carboxylase biotin carboxyl carrier protein [Evansella vedderi]
MLKIQEIRELIKLIDDSTIEEFKFEQNGSKITMKKHLKGENVSTEAVREVHTPAPVQTVVTEPAPPKIEDKPVAQQTEVKTETITNYHKITSPMVGTFYAAPSPESPPYVKAGDKIKGDTVVCIVEAMKLMNEIEAEVNGEIVEVLVENGQLVEYGQELFLVKPE